MSIYVEPNGNVIVRAPDTINLDKINNIVDLKAYWIYKAIAEIKELNKTKVIRSFVNGEGFLYLGKSYRLKIAKNQKCPLSLKQGYFLLDENELHKSRDHFINFYKTKAEQHVKKRVKYFKKKIGVEPEKIRVMKLGNRWASRSKTGLNFHWKIMLAPITVIDYIIVHELVHFKKEGHSHEFWEIVESLLPDYAKKRNWLRLNGANLNI